MTIVSYATYMWGQGFDNKEFLLQLLRRRNLVLENAEVKNSCIIC